MSLVTKVSAISSQHRLLSIQDSDSTPNCEGPTRTLPHNLAVVQQTISQHEERPRHVKISQN